MANLPHHELVVQRPALTVSQRKDVFKYTTPEVPSVRQRIQSQAKLACKCSPKKVGQIVKSRIPILDWLPPYSPSKSLVGDFIAGCTVAVMHIPQGLAYAMLAGLPPICGLYMGFFPVLVYAVFGSSRHNSIGTFAVVCMMAGKTITHFSTVESRLGRTNLTDAQEMETGYTPEQVAGALSMMVGLWQIILGLLQLGVLSSFFSDMLVSGFTTGAAVHVMTSQIRNLFGLTIPRISGPLKLIYTYVEILRQVLTANPAEMVISFVTIFVLVINSELFKPHWSKRFKIPFPIELFAVIIGTTISYYGDLTVNYQVTVIGVIPTGLPQPTLPPVELFSAVAGDAFVITIVSYTISYSMARIFAQKNQYQVDATQEFYAHGLSNIAGSFFSCAPVSTSLSRSLIQEATGGKTQIAAFVSCGFLLMILLFIGPVFQFSPNCVLSSIIVVALKGMFMQIYDLASVWKLSRLDSLIWIASFLGTVIIDIDYGLIVGVIASLMILLYRNQLPATARLGSIANTDMYLDMKKYPLAREILGIRIFQYCGCLHFANRDFLRTSLITTTGLDPSVFLASRRKMEKLLAESCESINAKEKIPSRFSCLMTRIKQWRSRMPRVKSGNQIDSLATNDVNVEEKGQINEGKVISEKDDTTTTQTRNGSNNYIKDVDYSERIEYPTHMITAVVLPEVECLILELSGLSYVDSSGAKFLAKLFKEFSEAGITVCLAGISENVMETLEKCGTTTTITHDFFFHTVHDAVTIVLAETKRQELHSHL